MPLQSRNSRGRYICHLAVQIAKARGAYRVGSTAFSSRSRACRPPPASPAPPPMVIRGESLAHLLTGFGIWELTVWRPRLAASLAAFFRARHVEHMEGS
jgi:hypothetical protein